MLHALERHKTLCYIFEIFRITVQRDELETRLGIRMKMHRGLDHVQMLMLDVGKRIDKSVLLVVVSQ